MRIDGISLLFFQNHKNKFIKISILFISIEMDRFFSPFHYFNDIFSFFKFLTTIPMFN
jgi:hypothetical protein